MDSPPRASDAHSEANAADTTAGRNGNGNSTTREPPNKRRRISLACRACRIRKSRCNGVRPICESCDRLGFECSYEMAEAPPVSLTIGKDTFNSLEERVRRLEQTVRQHEERLSTVGDVPSGGQGASPCGSAQEPLLTPGTAMVNVQGVQEHHESPGMTDGMAISFVDEEDCGFFGPSSNIAFMRHIFRAMAREGGVIGATTLQSDSDSFDAGIISMSKPGPSALASSPANPDPRSKSWPYILPPDDETEKLISAYFSDTGLLFPYIHEPTFRETYEQMKIHNFRANVRKTWLGLLNMVLAMAVSTTGWAQNRNEFSSTSSEEFYQRARELCETQMLRGTTLEIVQYLLLASQYLQGSQNSVQTWTTYGLAVKAALSIGLHSRDACNKFNPVEQETRKRTWYGCVLLDRTLCMTFGRPSAIPEEYVTIELPIGSPGNTHDKMSVSFYNATIVLYKVLWKVMANLYGHNLGCDVPASETSIITRIFQLEQDLNDWQDSLPSSGLRLISGPTDVPETPTDHIFERYSVVLTLRYLNTQLLLHRPALTKALSDYAADQSPAAPRRSISQTQENFARNCVHSAEDIISIIHCVLVLRPGMGRRILGAWWFTLYYTLNAALTIFGSLLIPLDRPDADICNLSRRERASQVLENAITALGYLDSGNALLERCISYLRQLARLAKGSSSSSPLPMPPFTPGQRIDQSGSITVANGAPVGGFDVELSDQASTLVLKPNLGGELELGPFFTDEFQQWIGQLP